MLYITHDLVLARHIADRVAVMYAGKIVEIGDTETVIQGPLHPYTRALLAATPSLDQENRLTDSPVGVRASAPFDAGLCCRFVTSCGVAVDRCREAPHPPIVPIGSSHAVACYEADRNPR